MMADTIEKLPDIVLRFIGAWNDHDAEAIRACLTEDGYFIDSIEECEIVGDDIIAYAEHNFEISPDMHFEILNRTSAATGSAAVQWIMTGHNLEAFFKLPVSGEKVSVLGVDFLTLEGDKIRTDVSYYDVTSLGRGIDKGVLGSEQSRAAAAEIEVRQRSRLSDEATAKIKGKLESLMQGDAIFTDPLISLSKLAERMAVSPTYLSQVINGEYRLSFRDFINRHRVEKAKSMLTDGRMRDTSVIQVGYNVGFNSSSVFYAAFQRFTGITPLKYRQG
jgi:steroid delta-isomerase-like uncharacterized protein